VKQCTYIYGPGDASVKSGKYKVGDRCASLRASEKTHWLCGGHLKQYNRINDPEYNRKAAEKQKVTLKKSREKAKKTNQVIVDNIQEKLDGQTASILGVLNKNANIDLEKEYLILKNLKQDPTQENYSEKYAFALWLNAPETCRTPKTIEEVAGILGVAPYTLSQWRRSPEIVRIINNDTKQVALRMYPWVLEKLFEGVGRGDKGFTDIALKHIKEIEAATETGKQNFNLSDKLKEEAARIANDGTGQRAMGVVDKAQKVVNFDALIAGRVKPEGETVQ
jgi:hypothetical protein